MEYNEIRKNKKTHNILFDRDVLLKRKLALYGPTA